MNREDDIKEFKEFINSDDLYIELLYNATQVNKRDIRLYNVDRVKSKFSLYKQFGKLKDTVNIDNNYYLSTVKLTDIGQEDDYYSYSLYKNHTYLGTYRKHLLNDTEWIFDALRGLPIDKYLSDAIKYGLDLLCNIQRYKEELEA